ncbi:MAG: M81 family metallopeptidase, partial [Actinomycetota bacterium]|nr:M81 family metallopeptidase [Actinomycetota bacterium]
MMRAVVAMMEHETNTFSPVPTPLSRFGLATDPGGVPVGDEVRRRFRGTGTGLGGLLDVVETAGMDIVTPVGGNAAPSGPVDVEAYEFMAGAICDAVAAGCDACFLDLHGAMVTQPGIDGDPDDGEGTLLARIRRIAPDL